MTLRLHSTLTGHKDVFVPRTDGRVTMFVCGPTVYARSHIGHGKTYTQFDFVARYFTYLGYRVTYAQNITDIDDKIITKAAEEGREPHQLAAQYENEYMSDMAALHNTNVDIYARAHDHIDQIVSQIETLIDRGHAYQLDDGWYFDLSTFSDYGKLYGRRETHAEDSVARIDEHDNKRNPGDFALWKMRKDGEPYWDTTLGPGRPGWHIEDTAITETLFGPQYDLHGGAVDLIFPHHEAEIAQQEAASDLVPFVKYWMHAGFLENKSEKMSKSLGNFATLHELLAQYDPAVIRFYLLSNHYRSPLDFNEKALDTAQAAVNRIGELMRKQFPTEDISLQTIETAMDDDFNTPAAFAAMFDIIRDANKRGVAPSAGFFTFINSVFGIVPTTTHTIPSDIQDIVDTRQVARDAKDFATSDSLRDQLATLGYTVDDTSYGPLVKKN